MQGTILQFPVGAQNIAAVPKTDARHADYMGAELATFDVPELLKLPSDETHLAPMDAQTCAWIVASDDLTPSVASGLVDALTEISAGDSTESAEETALDEVRGLFGASLRSIDVRTQIFLLPLQSTHWIEPMSMTNDAASAGTDSAIWGSPAELEAAHQSAESISDLAGGPFPSLLSSSSEAACISGKDPSDSDKAPTPTPGVTVFFSKPAETALESSGALHAALQPPLTQEVADETGSRPEGFSHETRTQIHAPLLAVSDNPSQPDGGSGPSDPVGCLGGMEDRLVPLPSAENRWLKREIPLFETGAARASFLVLPSGKSGFLPTSSEGMAPALASGPGSDPSAPDIWFVRSKENQATTGRTGTQGQSFGWNRTGPESRISILAPEPPTTRSEANAGSIGAFSGLDPGQPDRMRVRPSAALMGHPLNTVIPEMVAQIVKGRASSSEGLTLLTLSPEDLGQVRLSFQQDGHKADAMIVRMDFDRPETQDLFRRHVDQLSDMLKAAGFAGVRIGFGGTGARSSRKQHEDIAAPPTAIETPLAASTHGPAQSGLRMIGLVTLDIRL